MIVEVHEASEAGAFEAGAPDDGACAVIAVTAAPLLGGFIP
jgi:hypothetical protein